MFCLLEFVNKDFFKILFFDYYVVNGEVLISIVNVYFIVMFCIYCIYLLWDFKAN